MSSVPLGRIGGLATAARILAYVVGAVSVLSALLGGLAVDDAEDFLAGTISEDDFVAAYAPAVLLGLVQTATFVALIVVTMLWMRRVAANHRQLGRTGTWGPGWAIGGWFLPPFVLYVIPWLMFREMWKASDPGVPLGDDRWRDGTVSRVVDVWWVLYGLAPIALIAVQGARAIGGGISSSTGTEGLAEQVRDGFTASMIAGVLSLAAAIAYAALVTGLSGRHRQLTGEATSRA
jgi:hypothetical protein